jgi:hypothetical protein
MHETARTPAFDYGFVDLKQSEYKNWKNKKHKPH